MEIGTVISRVLDIIISKQLLMEFTFKGTKTKPAFYESVLYKILDGKIIVYILLMSTKKSIIIIFYVTYVAEVTVGLRKSKITSGELDPFDTKVSNLVKHAKRDYEIMVKKYSNINECK